MLVSDLDYELPEELIAQYPLEERDASGMLVLNHSALTFHDSKFDEFPTYLNARDVLVINNTRVFPARLLGRREPSGGQVELFLIRELESQVWETLARPARRLSKGTSVSFGNGELRAEVTETYEDGRRVVRFAGQGSLESCIDELGQTPLPPYIKRAGENSLEDRERYQTIYARHRGAVAAPTAGLHFTSEVMDNLKAKGTTVVEITLHVGYGTFQPVRVKDFDDHRVAREFYEISVEAAKQLNNARRAKHRIVAVGTTTTRALESALDVEGKIISGARMAELTITPGYKFRVVDSVLTNFHLPRSSLLALVAAFAGPELTLSAYKHAVKSRYRFYSYGDCMLII